MRNEKIKKALDLLRKKEWEACDYASNANEAADILEQLLADQPAQDDVEQSSTQSKETFDQPVAWKDEQGNVRMTIDSGEIQSSVGYVYSVHGERIKNACIRSDITNGTPLYTRPQKPAQDEPVAWADLNALTEQFNSVNCGTAYRLSGEGRQPLYTRPQAREPLEGVIDVQPIGYHSLQLIFRSQTDIAKFKAAHGIKGGN